MGARVYSTRRGEGQLQSNPCGIGIVGFWPDFGHCEGPKRAMRLRELITSRVGGPIRLSSKFKRPIRGPAIAESFI